MKTIQLTCWTVTLTLLFGVLPLAEGQTRAPAGNEQPNTTPAGVRSPDNMTLPEGLASDPSSQPARSRVMTAEQHAAFVEAVDVSGFRDVAVFHGGRAKIIDTMAREILISIYGKPVYTDMETGQTYDPTFTYLDLLFNASYYDQKPLVHIENLNVRRALLSHLPEAEKEIWLRRGRLTPLMLVRDPKIREAMTSMQSDVNKLAALNQVAVALETVRYLPSTAQLVSPPAGSVDWLDVFSLHGGVMTEEGETQATLSLAADPEAASQALVAYADLGRAWRAGDADRVNALLSELKRLLPMINPTTYPSGSVRQAELIYNGTRRFTVSYIAYFAAFIVLVIALGTTRKWLLGLGAVLLGIGFIGHTLGLVVRMIIAGRFTIHNQFESYIMLTWFGVLAGVLLLIFKRQWLFGAAAAALAAIGLLIANTAPIPSADAGPVAGILATSRILYVHVNVIIFSYALIALGFVVSIFYLVVYYLSRRETLTVAAAGLHENVTLGEDGSLLRGRQAVLHDLDRAQMVVLQMAFWLLAVGILLGAYWADHSWGRWWGWDPKETWALITWIIYLIVIHVRFTVKRRGLITAILSVIGFFVMLWTHWGVNLLLPGLHSYA